MSARSIAINVVNNAYSKTKDLSKAFERAKAVLRKDIDNLNAEGDKVQKQLEDRKAPESYIKERVFPYRFGAERLLKIHHAVLQLKNDGWEPK